MSVDRDRLCNGPGQVSVGGIGDSYDVGSLGSGVEIQWAHEFLHINPQQCSGDIATYRTKEGADISFTIWEPTLKNMDLFLFGGDGTFASEDHFGGDDTPEAFEPVVVYGTAPGGGQRAVTFDRMVAVEPGAYIIDRTQSHGYPAKLHAHVEPLTGVMGDVTDS